ATLPGAGTNNDSRGGGAFALHAFDFTLNGVINVDGGTAQNLSRYGGAGGSVHLQIDNDLQGRGAITARGAGYSLTETANNIAGGGRVSIHARNYYAVTTEPSTSLINVNLASAFAGK